MVKTRDQTLTDEKLLDELAELSHALGALLERVNALHHKLEDRIDLEESRAARKEAKEHGSVPWETVEKELGL